MAKPRDARNEGGSPRRKKSLSCLFRFVPLVTRVVICVSRAFSSTDQEKRETARSLKEDNMQYFLVVLLINFIILSCQTKWLHYKIEYTTLYVDETGAPKERFLGNDLKCLVMHPGVL